MAYLFLGNSIFVVSFIYCFIALLTCLYIYYLDSLPWYRLELVGKRRDGCVGTLINYWGYVCSVNGDCYNELGGPLWSNNSPSQRLCASSSGRHTTPLCRWIWRSILSPGNQAVWAVPSDGFVDFI